MKSKEILDSDFNEDTPLLANEILKWWEGKRLLYNILLLAVEVMVMLYYRKGTEIFGVSDAIFQTLLVNLVANIFYSLGWGVEIFITYYFPKIKFNETLRMTFLILGILFSLILAWISYTATLYYYQ